MIKISQLISHHPLSNFESLGSRLVYGPNVHVAIAKVVQLISINQNPVNQNFRK